MPSYSRGPAHGVVKLVSQEWIVGMGVGMGMNCNVMGNSMKDRTRQTGQDMFSHRDKAGESSSSMAVQAVSKLNLGGLGALPA